MRSTMSAKLIGGGPASPALGASTRATSKTRARPGLRPNAIKTGARTLTRRIDVLREISLRPKPDQPSGQGEFSVGPKAGSSPRGGKTGVFPRAGFGQLVTATLEVNADRPQRLAPSVTTR